MNRTLVFMIRTTLGLTVGWTALHYWLGARRVGFCLVVYFVLNVIALLKSSDSKSNTAQTLHLAAFFVLPLLATFSEGGWEASGFIGLWSFMPVLEISIYKGYSAAGWLFAVYAALACILLYMEVQGVQMRAIFDWMDLGTTGNLSQAGRYLLYGINIVGTGGVSLGLLRLGAKA